MNKRRKNSGLCPAWRWAAALLALLLLAGCPLTATDPPEDTPTEQPGEDPPDNPGPEQPPEENPADKPGPEEPPEEETPDNPGPEEPPEEETPPLAIAAFSIAGIAGIIDERANPKTITLTLPEGTDLGSLAPAITLSDPAAVIRPASGEAQDFTRPVTYTLSLEGAETSYRVSVSAALPAARDGRAISGFSINGVAGIIDEAARTITLTLPFGTDLKALAPEISLSEGATVSPASGEAQNFAASISIPKRYKVTAENGMQAEYKATVQTAAQNNFTLTLDKELSITPATATLSRTGSATVSATRDYDRYQWHIDGKPAGTDGRTITLKGEDYYIGSHYLGVTAYQNGIPFYGEITFTITP